MSNGTGSVGVREVDAQTARRWIDSGEAALVDVREPDERAAEWIEGSRLVALSKFDASALPSGKVVLHCKGGRRSAEACARATAAGRGGDVFSLRGGIEAWKQAGLPTGSARVPISIIRQVQIVVGTVVAASSALAWFVSPWFVVLSGLMGVGLLFAGMSGTCGMAVVLSFMPWNRALRVAPASVR